MSHGHWLPNLGKEKLFAGKASQIKEWNEVFQVRSKSVPGFDNVHYYIAWKGTTRQVEGTGEFRAWNNAKEFINENWKKLVDEEFEREFLLGSEGSEANDKTED